MDRRFHVYGHCPFISCTAVSAATLAYCGPVALVFFLAICGLSSNGLPVVVSIVVSTSCPTCSAKRKTLAAIFCAAEAKAARGNVVEEKPAGIPDERQFDIGHRRGGYRDGWMKILVFALLRVRGLEWLEDMNVGR
jgi:hypothetical protein